jgi:hypothetical protein
MLCVESLAGLEISSQRKQKATTTCEKMQMKNGISHCLFRLFPRDMLFEKAFNVQIFSFFQRECNAMCTCLLAFYADFHISASLLFSWLRFPHQN